VIKATGADTGGRMPTELAYLGHVEEYADVETMARFEKRSAT
jgi:hypothetical protein